MSKFQNFRNFPKSHFPKSGRAGVHNIIQAQSLAISWNFGKKSGAARVQFLIRMISYQMPAPYLVSHGFLLRLAEI